jgi:hypothetical protein
LRHNTAADRIYGALNVLTENQNWVLKMLRKRNGEWIAAATEEHWQAGDRYYIDARVNVSREIRRRFERGNREAESKPETDQ